MKKIIPFLLITLTLNTYAQRNSGFKFGTNTSWTSTTRMSDPLFSDNFKLLPKTTLQFGYSWNIPLFRKFTIQTDLLYNTKGGDAELKKSNTLPAGFDPNNPLDQSFISNVAFLHYSDYLSLPLTVSYSLPNHLFMELGAETSISIKGYADLWDFSLLAGVGYTTKYADISLRYIHGLSGSTGGSTSTSYGDANNPEVTVSHMHTDKNRTLQLSLTIPIFKYLRRREL